MMWVRVPNDSLGRTVKKTLEVLQNRNLLGSESFGYIDLPAVGADYLAKAERELPKFGSSVLMTADEMAKTTVLQSLKKTGLIESIGAMQFRLTKKGREAIVRIDWQADATRRRPRARHGERGNGKV
jgi:hypothetical protein